MADILEIENGTMGEIIEFADYGSQMLALKGDENPKEIVSKINQFVSDAKEQKRQFSQDEILALGILLGWQYVNGLQWEWGEAVWDGDIDTSAIGVLNADNSLFNNPMAWMNSVLNSDRVPNFLLNYNMVAGNKVPKAQPNEARMFH